MIYYIRDEEGSLIGIKYNHDIYYYIKNLQEDIIGITDNNYNVICRYEYDSWGKVITIKDNNGNIIEDESHIGIINPYRYRSYYYDKETKLYYLNSRYYNPEWGRFINTDKVLSETAFSCNLYWYCINNPIKSLDSSGNSVSSIFSGIVNWGQKTIEIFTNKNTKSKPKDKKKEKNEKKKTANFVCEAGYGKGTSVTINNIGFGRYNDITYGISNKQTYSKISGVEYQAKIGEFGISKTFEMEYPFPKDFSYYVNDPLHMKNMLRSPYVVRSTETSFSQNNLSTSINGNGLFLGIDADLHLGIGGHFKCGVDTNLTLKDVLLIS